MLVKVNPFQLTPPAIKVMRHFIITWSPLYTYTLSISKHARLASEPVSHAHMHLHSNPLLRNFLPHLPHRDLP